MYVADIAADLVLPFYFFLCFFFFSFVFFFSHFFFFVVL